MYDNFTESELRNFSCFIDPKYPAATRTVGAVAKETGLEETVVTAVFKDFMGTLFQPVTKVKWSFNLVMFMAKFHKKYPHLFTKFDIKQTPGGLIMGPKGMCQEKFQTILQGVIDDPEQPEELCNLLKGVLKPSESPEPLGGDNEVLSFSM